uniref:Uncharacterized protein n=1 Tax=Panagrolaimus sp. ES5 TaxID=591445 RepID=A0AC34FBX7_9BILA
MSLLPSETIATMSNINESLKKLTKAIKEFSAISSVEQSKRLPMEQAEIYMTAMYATVSLAAVVVNGMCAPTPFFILFCLLKNI